MSQTPNQDMQDVAELEQTPETPRPAISFTDSSPQLAREIDSSAPAERDESPAPVQPLLSTEPQLPQSAPPPPRRRGRDTTIITAILAILLTIGGAVFGTTAYNNNHQALASRATATAQTLAAAVQQRAQVQATATAVASTYPFSNNLVLNDPLSNTSNVGQYGWDNDGTNCSFSAGSYRVLEKISGHFHLCAAETPTFTDFTFEVQMAIKSGGNGASGGVIFRGDSTTDHFYVLFLDTQGNYELDVQTNQNGTNTRTLKSGQIADYAGGFSQVNTIGVVAKGSEIRIFVNRVQVAQVFDSSYTSGQIGVISSYGSSTTEVDYNNAKVWQL